MQSLFELLILGALLHAVIMAPVVAVKSYRNHQRRTQVAVGKVTDVRFGKLHWGVNVPRPEIEFRDANGGLFRFHSEVGASWNPWRTGDAVRICYEPGDPGNAEIAFQKSHYYAGAVVLGTVWLYFVSILYKLVTGLLAGF
jgi:hypothetical protein